MRVMLIQQVLLKALSGRGKVTNTLSEEQKDEILEKEHSVILLCLGNEILLEVAEENMTLGLWLRLESKYMMKPLMNRLYLKQ
ncbi:hypothetical protein ES319_A10G084100v1 [Gossypium barbadense]|uniref:Uncharacterized protein n=2 Tax=Gossypium TaxID=3633 RepID=A0A5J5U2L9_GOSBA|nr:hypothetical protein ES319_A10G084100v1 [Gossypium barbadense]TYG98126.1 hypothetical protein ES288_A10G092500v1 [Gossypium darwinii]